MSFILIENLNFYFLKRKVATLMGKPAEMNKTKISNVYVNFMILVFI